MFSSLQTWRLEVTFPNSGICGKKCVRFLDSFYYYETISKVNALLTTSLGEPHLNKKWSLAFSKTLVYTTLNILISEGDIKFPYVLKLVSQKDLGSIVHFGIIR